MVAFDSVGTDDQICRQQTGFGHRAPLPQTFVFVPCHSSPGAHHTPTTSSRSLASHRKAIRSRHDGNVAVFDGAREHTARFLNGIDAGIGRMAISIPFARAREGKLGLQDVQQLNID